MSTYLVEPVTIEKEKFLKPVPATKAGFPLLPVLLVVGGLSLWAYYEETKKKPLKHRRPESWW